MSADWAAHDTEGEEAFNVSAPADRVRIPTYPIIHSEGSDHCSGDPIRESERSDELGDGQVAGWESGWGLRPFWRRIDPPRSVSTWAL
jgi:hypothetical protein